MTEEVELFQEVKEVAIPKVLEALKKDWPKHFILHQLLTVLGDFKKAGCRWRHILYLFGDYEDGVYLNTVNFEIPTNSTTYLYLYTLSSDMDRVETALKNTKVVNWKDKLFMFRTCENRLTTPIKRALGAHCVDCEISENKVFWYPPEKKFYNSQLPEDVYINFLDGSFAEEINFNWPYKFPGSEMIIKEYLEKNFGLGMFRKDDKKLVCSVLSSYSGAINVLYTAPECRGKGYALAMVLQMVQEIRLRGRIPFSNVVIGNTPSEMVFTKSGFEIFSRQADYIHPI